jgi:hypothetical protein
MVVSPVQVLVKVMYLAGAAGFSTMTVPVWPAWVGVWVIVLVKVPVPVIVVVM